MKKQYLTPPKSEIVGFGPEGFMAASKLSADGGENIDISVSEEEHAGAFRSGKKDWGSEAWGE